MTHSNAVLLAIEAVNKVYADRPALADEIDTALQELLMPEMSVDIDVYDEEEIHENCTVQILQNSVTGKISIGWWENE